MFPKTRALLAAAAFTAAPAFAETAVQLDDFFVNCVSSMDQSNVTLVRSGGSDKGFIMTKTLEGEANIYPGVNSMTFLLMQDKNVITFVVDYDKLEYDMMVKGAGQTYDRGICAAS